MEPVYVQEFTVDEASVDCYLRMKPSYYLYLAQEMAGQHSTMLSLDYDTLAEKGIFWAVSRHRVQVTRTPMVGEKLRVETWPMPPTRSSFPRSVVAYDEQGNECFRAMSLWVLMDIHSRKLIVPGKSGIILAGTVRGDELPAPAGLVPKTSGVSRERAVAFTDLDRNGHMNNTRCMEWIADLFPGSFHAGHTLKEFTVCYLSEAKEGQLLHLNLEMPDEANAQLDASFGSGEDSHRVFSARLFFEPTGV